MPARDVPMDGALVYSCDSDSAALDWLTAAGFPLVYVDQTPVPGASSVNVDDRAGARAAAEHVVSLGHRRVAILTSEKAGPHGVRSPPDLASHHHVSRTRCWAGSTHWMPAGIEPLVIRVPLKSEEAAYSRGHGCCWTARTRRQQSSASPTCWPRSHACGRGSRRTCARGALRRRLRRQPARAADATRRSRPSARTSRRRASRDSGVDRGDRERSISQGRSRRARSFSPPNWSCARAPDPHRASRQRRGTSSIAMALPGDSGTQQVKSLRHCANGGSASSDVRTVSSCAENCSSSAIRSAISACF